MNQPTSQSVVTVTSTVAGRIWMMAEGGSEGGREGIISLIKEHLKRIQRSMTRDSFWIRFNKKSPCLIVAWYRAFFASGLLVSNTPATLSILQCSFPAAMNRDSSLQTPPTNSTNIIYLIYSCNKITTCITYVCLLSRNKYLQINEIH